MHTIGCEGAATAKRRGVIHALLPAAFAAVLMLAVVNSPGKCSPRAVRHSSARVVVYPDEIVQPLHKTLFGINVHPHAKPNIAKPEIVECIKARGITSCRFPNGCVADLYNWKDPGANWATVDEFLQFCEDIGAEPYYTLNLQGGTEGLSGPAPKDLPLDETIKYQHLKPNPCQNTNFHFGTLAETLELLERYTIQRARDGKRPILNYEMGNENWGQARTDWPPEVYARTIEVYAKAMRAALERAIGQYPELAGLRLHICAVGYPTMSSDVMRPNSPGSTMNANWTGLLNKLHSEGVIDAVQEHYYPSAPANGGAVAWVAHNLHNIIRVRKGLPNPRLDGFYDTAAVYQMPLEFTEWNIWCWGNRFAGDIQPSNPGFEDGLEDWSISGGSARAVSWAARRGMKGLRVEVRDGADVCEVSQVFEAPEQARTFSAGVWVRTDNPDAVSVLFRAADGKILGRWGAAASGAWQRVVATARLPERAGKIELVLRIDKPSTTYFDEVQLYNVSEDRRPCPLSAETYEQVLFCVDAFREMALGGIRRAHLHHLFGNYPCTIMTMAGEPKSLAKVFEFFAGACGENVVRAQCQCENISYGSVLNRWATHYGEHAPDRDDIPALACMASRDNDALYLLLINRSSDTKIEALIDLNADPSDSSAAARVISGEDIDLPGASLDHGVAQVGRTFSHSIDPYSATILRIALR